MSLLGSRPGKNAKGYRLTFDEVKAKHVYYDTAQTHRDVYIDVLASDPQAALAKAMNIAQKDKDSSSSRIEFKKLELVCSP